MSHVQLLELRGMLKEDGIGKQGHTRSPSDNARALLHVAVHQQHGLSFDAAIKATAAAELASPHTIRTAVQQFSTSGSLPSPSTAQRGRGNPDHPLHSSNTEEYGPSFEAELLMHELVHKQKTEGITVTATTIAAELRARLNIDESRRTVRRWLRALGYRWRDKRYIGGMKPQAKNARIRQFIVEYAAALAEEAAGKAVIVYIDESFIHAHLASRARLRRGAGGWTGRQ
jgi:transposase